MFDLFNQPPLEAVRAKRDTAMASVAVNAGTEFGIRARAFVLKYLAEHGPSPGEVVTDACKEAGIKAHDDRAMGPVYMGLSQNGFIEKAGFCQRKKGNLTGGGLIWKLIQRCTVNQEP